VAGSLNTARSHDDYGDYCHTVTSRFEEGRVTKACSMACFRVMSGPRVRSSHSKPVDRTGTVRVATDRPVCPRPGIDAMKPSRHARVSFARTGHQGTRQQTPPAYSVPQMPNPHRHEAIAGSGVAQQWAIEEFTYGALRVTHRGASDLTLISPIFVDHRLRHRTTSTWCYHRGARGVTDSGATPIARYRLRPTRPDIPIRAPRFRSSLLSSPS
jgi:hypothetical protein